MTEDILINVTPQETRVALILQGAVQELHVERTASRGRAGNVYLGRVVRVLPGMQSAFIDIGLERAAFLHVADIWEARARDGTNAPLQAIEKLLFDGQNVLVQVIKDPIGTKGARLSTQISIAGRMLVYLPQDPHIGISQRIENEADRDALRQRMQRLLPTDERGGFIVRTMAEDSSEHDLSMDIDYLRKTWATVTQQAKSRPSPALLYQDLSLAQRVLRDFVHDETTTIQVDSRENFQKLHEFATIYTPSV
ncbi:ribonuclease E/G, partial [Lacisediminimonas sp.]|uniref:ribonuclease E/G n=1 Tax=Lacisediminimonas sp. TaxID=3060582 RepID=UPI00271D839B